MPKTVSDGTNYVLIACPSSCGEVVISGDGVILYSNMPASVGHELAASGPGLLTTWNSSYGINGNIFTEAGTSLTNFSVSVTFYNDWGYNEAIAGNGADFLMAYNPHTTNNPVLLTQISATGNVVQSPGLQVTTGVTGTQLELAWNGRCYLLAYPRMDPFDVDRMEFRILDPTPRFSAFNVQDNQLNLTLDGMADRVFEIEASSDLLTWKSVGQVTNQNGTVCFSLPFTFEQSFFRACQLP